MSSLQPADPFALAKRLDGIRSAGRFRTRRTISTPQGALVRSAGRTFINFSSNDYLGLANDARVVQALQSGAAEYGAGSGASQLICGRSRAHAALEDAVARRLGRSRAVLFSSGYLANLAVITSFAPRREDVVVMDRENHASLIDGALLTRARLRRYPHHDLSGLENLCDNACALVATDAVFSMDGSIAALPDIAGLCARRGILLAVDDAHGFGVLGKTGAGTLEHFSLTQAQAPVLMGTFGKACGGAGAFVAGPDEVIETLIQTGRSCIYSTALAPALAVAAIEALAIIETESWRREQLRALIDRFVRGARQLGLPLLASETPIQSLLTGNAAAAVSSSEQLRERGIWVSAIRAPTVAKNTERLRITLNVGHSDEQVDRLLEALAQQARRLWP